jgi:ABC-type oligopeptide transport system ATPase subunit
MPRDGGPASDTGPILQVENLSVHFPVTSGGLLRRRTGSIRAVDGVSFDLARG